MRRLALDHAERRLAEVLRRDAAGDLDDDRRASPQGDVGGRGDRQAEQRRVTEDRIRDLRLHDDCLAFAPALEVQHLHQRPQDHEQHDRRSHQGNRLRPPRGRRAGGSTTTDRLGPTVSGEPDEHERTRDESRTNFLDRLHGVTSHVGAMNCEVRASETVPACKGLTPLVSGGKCPSRSNFYTVRGVRRTHALLGLRGTHRDSYGVERALAWHSGCSPRSPAVARKGARNHRPQRKEAPCSESWQAWSRSW